MADLIQNLNVLVAEVQCATFVSFSHPNYALLASAAGIIKSVLERVLAGQLPQNLAADDIAPIEDTSNDWMPWIAQDFWDSEIDFWRNLAEHPTLAGTDAGLDGLL